ncbi:MAG TPA: MauE/DoxX family redox-associated membrane protein [Bacteroidia bacterium]|nr:MauE/DoxX family redox-associated membrane protein [Bacteroidia bacterium]
MKKLSLYSMALFYLLAGINHFYSSNFYETIMPAYIGYHKLLIEISGVVEILLALILIPNYTRRIAATLIAVMLVIFLWLHIQMLIDFWSKDNKHLWIAILRVPMQFILIWWAYSFTSVMKQKKTA